MAASSCGATKARRMLYRALSLRRLSPPLQNCEGETLKALSSGRTRSRTNASRVRAAMRLLKIELGGKSFRRDWCLEDPMLRDLPNLKMQAAKNYRLTPDHAARLFRVDHESRSRKLHQLFRSPICERVPPEQTTPRIRPISPYRGCKGPPVALWSLRFLQRSLLGELPLFEYVIDTSRYC